MDSNEHVSVTPGTDQKGTDMSERKYGGEVFRGGTLADMLWVEEYVTKNGYEAWAQLRDEIGEDHRQREAYRAERDAEYAAYVAEYGESVQDDDDLDWYQPDQPSSEARYPQADAAWDTAVGVAYREVVLDYGNDGRPEDDRHLSDEERSRRADAVTVISQTTGLPQGDVWREVQDAAWKHGQSDDYSTHLRAHDWDQLIEMHRQDSYDRAYDALTLPGIVEREPDLNEVPDYWRSAAEEAEADCNITAHLVEAGWTPAEIVEIEGMSLTSAEAAIERLVDHEALMRGERTAEATNAQRDQMLAEAHERDSEIDQLDAQAGQLRQDLAEGQARAEEEHDVRQMIEWTDRQIELAKGAAPTQAECDHMATHYHSLPGEDQGDAFEDWMHRAELESEQQRVLGEDADDGMTAAEFMGQSVNPQDRAGFDLPMSEAYYGQLAQAGVGPVPRETDQAIARDLVDAHPELVNVAELLSDSELLGAAPGVDPTNPAALAAAVADAEAAVTDLINGPRPGGDADGSAQEHELVVRGDPAADVGYLDAPADGADEARYDTLADITPEGQVAVREEPAYLAEVAAHHADPNDYRHYVSYDGRTGAVAWAEDAWDAADAANFLDLDAKTQQWLTDQATRTQQWLGEPAAQGNAGELHAHQLMDSNAAADDAVYPLDEVAAGLIADLDATPAGAYHGDAAETAAEDRADAEGVAHGEPPGKAEAADAVARAHQAVAELHARETTRQTEPVSQWEATSQAGDVLGDE
ncbi:MAG: hypothetical protein DLM62_05545 [Pseudonocardiales bacterium]|nr:MAG: hypothetical protein DLM62_05545 [Pseudonocardiales bacterium]